MQINSLIAVLKHGYAYDASDPNDMEQRVRVTVPPNKHMMMAGQVIEKLYNDNQNLIKKCLQLQDKVNELEGLYDDKTSVQDSSPVPTDGNASGDSDGRSS